MAQVDVAYCNLLKEICEKGVDKDSRAGKVRSIFGHQIRIDLSKGIPILSVRKMFARGVIEELLWFLRGETNIKTLVEKGVNIWTDDAYRHYCEITKDYHDNVNKVDDKETFVKDTINGLACYFWSYRKNKLISYKYGDLGPVYGKQWRNFGGRDQIAELIKTLKNNPDDRRLLVVAFNPGEIDDMALPPCHVMFQFYTQETESGKRRLSCMWIQRSVDCGCGWGFNVLSYAVLTHIIANVCGMEVGDLICSLGDTHIYHNQMDAVNTILERNTDDRPIPQLKMKEYDGKTDPIEWIENLKYEDFTIENYDPYPAVKMPLSVG